MTNNDVIYKKRGDTNMEERDELCFVTEVGTFGDLNIEDPTVQGAGKKKKKDDIEALIEAANEQNLNTLTAINE